MNKIQEETGTLNYTYMFIDVYVRTYTHTYIQLTGLEQITNA